MTIPSQVLEKRCTSCGQTKPRSDFYIRSHGGLNPECKPCARARMARVRDKDRVAYLEQQRQWRGPFKEKVRRAVFNAYGGHKCVCCGETERKFLTLDHVNNDGAEHRVKIAGKRTASGWQTYYWLYRNGFPSGLQVLCMNCNFGKRMNNGVCPHKERRNDYPSGSRVRADSKCSASEDLWLLSEDIVWPSG